MFSPPQLTQCSPTNADSEGLPGERGRLPKMISVFSRPLSVLRTVPSIENEMFRITESTSNVCSTAPEPASHSLTVLSHDADASVLPSGEKATALTPSEWPSSVCSNAFQVLSTSGNFRTHLGMQWLNCFLIMLVVGVNIRALQYIWRGACSIADRK